MNKISLFLIFSGLLFSVSLNAHDMKLRPGETVRPAGNNECYSNIRGYFFSRHHKACLPVTKAVTLPGPKMCSCPCAGK